MLHGLGIQADRHGDSTGVVKELQAVNCKIAFLLAGFGLAGISVYADDPQAIVPEKHLDLMYDHCMDCHNADTQKGR